ncbi:pentapeptide repeat-containing protein, partial [Streptomyces sp. NPDC088246]|uniref:pentapeptide repeat-containing protein n=1 Tax=Streptomyces sp. NPDC088246 TaxID=3365842 RepID=UPI00380ABB5A
WADQRTQPALTRPPDPKPIKKPLSNPLGGSRLSGADLSDADLFKTNLQRADLAGARLDHANLHSADLSGAWGLEIGQLSTAWIYSSTRLDPELTQHPVVQDRIMATETRFD